MRKGQNPNKKLSPLTHLFITKKIIQIMEKDNFTANIVNIFKY